MTSTPSGERLHLAFFGLRNAGKSSLLNAIAGRSVSIVSDRPGTTTDPVSRPMELGALGPVVLTDTAGLDDEGELGALRVEKSLERLSWADLALLVSPLHLPPAALELDFAAKLLAAGRPLVVVGSFADAPEHPEKRRWLNSLGEVPGPRPLLVARASGRTGEGVAELRQALADLGQSPRGSASEAGVARDSAAAATADHEGAPRGLQPRLARETGPLEGLVEAGDLVLLVTPIDSAAPRGRMILPEAETLRDALDRACPTLVVREKELAGAWAALARRPRLVVTDSQAFSEVVAAIPADQPLTSFSILFARKKGELARFATGLGLVARLAAARAEPGFDGAVLPPLRLLAIEACTHNRTHEDIATVKIPAALSRRSGRRVESRVLRELSDMPPGEDFDLAVTCGGCMATGGRMRAQLAALEEGGIPVLNFGIFLAWASGAFPRALEPLGGLAALAAEPSRVAAPGDVAAVAAH